jgi:hypothetical protein
MTLSQYYQWFTEIIVGRGGEKTKPIKANLGITKQFNVKKTEFALPSQTFYIGLAV